MVNRDADTKITEAGSIPVIKEENGFGNAREEIRVENDKAADIHEVQAREESKTAGIPRGPNGDSGEVPRSSSDRYYFINQYYALFVFPFFVRIRQIHHIIHARIKHELNLINVK